MRCIHCMYIFFLLSAAGISCKKASDNPQPTPVIETFKLITATINSNAATPQNGVNVLPVIKVIFTAAMDRNTVVNGIVLSQSNGTVVALNASYQNNDSVLILQPVIALAFITKYILSVNSTLKSKKNTALSTPAVINFITQIDSSDKFPVIGDSALLDKVQKQTFKYFWDFGHPVSGMARERNTSGDLVTTGGTGFGIMAIVAAVNRKFISRTAGVTRVLKITDFLTNSCTQYHGAFAHWINGASGATIPFSTDDDGADLVETSYLMQGLLTARQYFNTADITETDLRNKINILWNGVDWNWFRQGSQNVLYWHWSPNKAWIINAQISGWNEALITYVMAAASVNNSIPKAVYDSGWARNGAMKNNNTFFGYVLPLGPNIGGPLFFEHYSFLGINPRGLKDNYADYQTQTINHTLINYEYCKANPKQYYGYSSQCWGLTASDTPNNGYNANAPDNDIGVITPTAAISSLPYTPTQSMAALHFFYYKLGDKMWGDYGFYDAFSLQDAWFANSTLAIDQGPAIVMIENYRTSLLWNLFTSCPEVKQGLIKLGFMAPYL